MDCCPLFCLGVTGSFVPPREVLLWFCGGKHLFRLGLRSFCKNFFFSPRAALVILSPFVLHRPPRLWDVCCWVQIASFSHNTAHLVGTLHLFVGFFFLRIPHVHFPLGPLRINCLFFLYILFVSLSSWLGLIYWFLLYFIIIMSVS